MIYSTRLKKILEVCLQKDEYVKIDDLANNLKTSKRTIFREIKDVHNDLEEYDIKCVSKTGKGIKLEGSLQAKKALLHELQSQTIFYMNKEERQQLLLYELLRSDVVEKLFHYATIFQVSEATISKDLESIEAWLQTYQIYLVKKPGKGIEVIGKEKNVRKAMTDIVNQSMYEKQEHGYVNYLDSQTLLTELFMSDHGGSILKLLNQDVVMRILLVFEVYRHELSLDRYAQNSYIGLLIHLVIAIERILKNGEMQDYENVVHMVQDTESYQQAARIAHCLGTEFDIDLPESEIACIALHIQGAKITSSKYNNANDQEIEKMQKVIRRMLATYDEATMMCLQQDETLLHGLLTHLHPTITRLKNKLSIFNPLLQQIKQEYSVLFEQTKKACKYLEKEYVCNVNEDEVGFITMHIGAAMERMQHNLSRRKISIGVVCASGIGVSSLLSARIQTSISTPLDIHVLSIDEILKEPYLKCELLISTFRLEVEDRRVLQVTPLLNCEDIRNIKQTLETISNQDLKCKNLHVVTFKEELQVLHELSLHALDILEHIHCEQINANLDMLAIMKLAASIATKAEESQSLIIEDLKKRELQGSTFIKTYAFGLLHAKSSGITHSCIQFLYPKENTVFLLIDRIKFIMVMLMPKEGGRMQQEMLSTIAQALLEKSSFRKAIKERKLAGIEKEISMLLQTYLETKMSV